MNAPLTHNIAGFGIDNPILDTDSYKASHAVQYPPGTSYVYSYIESRGCVQESWKSIMFFGLQAFVKRYLTQRITHEHIEEAGAFWAAHGEPFYPELWRPIVDEFGGLLPIEIRALPEGLVVPQKTVLATVVNTDPRFFWLTSYVETALLRAIWYPSTVATLSFECKKIIKRCWERTSDAPVESIDFKLHDFGARGVSSKESAALGAMAHLVNFRGSDSVSGVLAARQFYGEEMAAFSIPAAEHSTITSWGKDREVDAYRNMLKQFGGKSPLIAVVSDSYDLFNAIENIWGKELKDEVLACGSTLVVRPDSGDPINTPIEAIKKLGDAFGFTTNAKGFRVLNPAVRVIQGDGITPETLGRICYSLEMAGWSLDNIAFGMGGGLLQQCTRDTFKFAQKASAAMVDGKWMDVMKDPVTDPGKRSKAGRFVVVPQGDGQYISAQMGTGFDWQDILVKVYAGGLIAPPVDFATIRARANSAL
jgi:nicotinamide phosphoribosyltransferase